MYLICYMGMGNTICVYARCDDAASIGPIIREVKQNEHKSSLKASQLFVLSAVVYPEIR